MNKLSEIQSAILQLDPAEREELRHWLDETAEETPEMLAAIDEGLRSLELLIGTYLSARDGRPVALPLEY